MSTPKAVVFMSTPVACSVCFNVAATVKNTINSAHAA